MTYRALFRFDKLSENAKTEYEQNVEFVVRPGEILDGDDMKEYTKYIY